MHPRNIYKTPPDFKKLAIEYPEFRPFVKVDLAGKAQFNFKDDNALSALSKTLLLKDFGLKVEIPTNKLIPTLPLRLNYILWLEDLMKFKNIDLEKEVYGIDIGTGASCIYPLLASKNKWHMLATDIDPESIESARANVEGNNLSYLITVKKVEKENSPLKGVVEDHKKYDFCMCNPPFFAYNEKPQNRTNNRKPPKRTFVSSPSEVETEGGEVAFVKKIISDSLQLKDQIDIFSSLIGKQCNVKILKIELESHGIKEIAVTEFIQGKTTRWGLAWSFSVSLTQAAISVASSRTKSKSKPSAPLAYVLPEGTTFQEAVDKFENLMSRLKLSFEIEESNPFTCNVTAFENTWSNQRRKRRAKLHNSGNMEPPAKITKVERKESENGTHCPSDNNKEADTLGSKECSEKKEKQTILEFRLHIFSEEAVSVQATWLEGSMGKEGMHQVLQYFKNNWNKLS